MASSKKEIMSLRKDQLDSRLNELRLELVKENTQIAAGTVPKNPGKVRQLKRNIARVLTAKNQKRKQKA